MTVFHRLASIVRWLLHRNRDEQQLDDDVREFIEMSVADKVRDGVSPAQARRLAVLELGGIEQTKERVRTSRHGALLDDIGRDVRYGCRMLVKDPGFTVVAVLALALGIGVNTTLFRAYNAVALKPLPVRDPSSVVRFERWLQSRSLGNVQYAFSYPEYVYCLDHNDQFSSLVAASWAFLSLASPQDSAATEHRVGQLVSANYFADLGVPLLVGRGFLPHEDHTIGDSPVVVISYRFWQSGLSGDQGILGRTIRLNGATFTIVGVTPQDFTGTTVDVVAPDFWAPLSMQAQLVPGRDWLNRPEQRSFQIFARLKPSANRSAAQAQADLLVRQFASTYSERDPTTAVTLQRTTYFPNTDDIRFRALMAAVMLTVGLVLLAACANVGNMMLARGAAREREISTRLALGAGRARVLRQLLVESMLLALVGGCAGLALAGWTTKLLALTLEQNAMVIGGDFSVVNLAPDYRVLTYVLTIAIGSGVLFGLSPALQLTRRDLTTALKSQGAAFGYLRESRLRNLLVGTQVAVSVLLLATAGLLARGLTRSQVAEPEFETRAVFTIAADFGGIGSDPTGALARKKRLLEKLREHREFVSVALGTRPFSGTWTPPIIAGNTRGGTLASYASEGYFETLGIPLLRGRLFTLEEAHSNARSAVISESTARRFWPDADDVLGKSFSLDVDFRGTLEQFEVIGIVKDVRFANLTRLDPAHVYLPAGANERGSRAFENGSFLDLLVRVQGDRRRALAAIETTVASSDPNLVPGLRLINLEDGMVRVQRTLSRTCAMLTATLAMVALTLAGIGIYGVIAHLVTQRTREIGVRLALGADTAAVWRDVILRGLRSVVVGILVGLATAAGLSALLHQTLIFPGSMDFLYGVSFYDPITFASLVAFVAAVAVAASAVPAHRAMRVDPAVTLRYE